MTFSPTPIAGLYVTRDVPFEDERGRFTRIYCGREFTGAIPKLRIVQANLSETRKRGTLRGMHFQRPPFAEAKLVRCLRGRVFDVAVDIRAGSPTFMKWHAAELAPELGNAMLIPAGFAHGFQTLTDDVQMLYLHSAEWSPEHEGGLRHDDDAIAIQWPETAMYVSAKDASYPLVNAAFEGIRA
jgi:dTDP-4-dehydrorhamnose 3,5-epimerase